jgi:HD-GYP domain-containing protein (c-di-GMP phosphodiesterase class II)
MRREDAIRTLREGSGTQWDGDLVERFLQVLDDRPQASSREARAS